MESRGRVRNLLPLPGLKEVIRFTKDAHLSGCWLEKPEPSGAIHVGRPFEEAWSIRGSHLNVLEKQSALPLHTGRVDRWITHFDLTECIYQLVAESQIPHKIITNCLLLLIEILSWRFCGGVDFPKLIHQYVVSDAHNLMFLKRSAHSRSMRVASRFSFSNISSLCIWLRA